ncbi:hypothetical protein AAFF_G00147140 [Aldrovandia affinis]|uniref:Uncharacterized protein n=1 Tax=Aldrovandia affinis TaxID=143900 RepID=A0AAD7RPM0_9TELE|nr:hypothetical protein AAFF_G00147140 [Aldrovandia affinis]
MFDLKKGDRDEGDKKKLSSAVLRRVHQSGKVLRGDRYWRGGEKTRCYPEKQQERPSRPPPLHPGSTAAVCTVGGGVRVGGFIVPSVLRPTPSRDSSAERHVPTGNAPPAHFQAIYSKKAITSSMERRQIYTLPAESAECVRDIG